jgi:LmbE family N-acetylglucosaminyl deacetylase
MLPLHLGGFARKLESVLCLGAHCDDIEIGCGGAVLELAARGRLEKVDWIVFTSTPVRESEARRSAERMLRNVPKRDVIIKHFRDGFLPYTGREIKEHFEELKARLSPQLVLTHYRGDLHQDHRLISDLTWNTFRNSMILEYEVPKYDGDLGTPNVFMEISEELAKEKIDILLESFESQRTKRWFSAELFQSLLRLRGMECSAASGLAEAFYGRKIVLG